MEVREPLPTEIAWFAGILDGEGCIAIVRQNPRSTDIHDTYHLRIRISNTHLPTVNRLKEIWNAGYVHEIFDKEERRKRRYEWVVSGRVALRVLQLSFQYLVTRSIEAEMGIEFQERKSKRKVNVKEGERFKELLSDAKRG